MTRQYCDADWAHGLHCTECDILFREGDPIHEVPVEGSCEGACPVFSLVCVHCATFPRPQGIKPMILFGFLVGLLVGLVGMIWVTTNLAQHCSRE